MRAALLLCALLFAAGAARAQQSFPLIPGDALSEGGDMLVTVALEEARLEPAYAADFAARYGAAVLSVWPLRSTGVLCLVLEARGDGSDLRARLRGDSEVLTAEPIRTYRTAGRAYADDLLPIQDAMHGMNVLAAHERSTGAGVRVAVIDTGVATDHPDLVDRPVDYADLVRVDPAYEIAESHGTAVAALIAADGANGHGIVGVAPDAELLALRACWEAADGEGLCNNFTLARALNLAILREADVINLSLEGPADPLLADLVATALEQGRTVVGAEGAGFPGAVPGVIAAGSGEGSVPAPAHEVISAAPGGGYDFYSGSSVAAAHVSGVVALIRADGAAPVAAALRERLDLAARGGGLDACRALVSRPGCP